LPGWRRAAHLLAVVAGWLLFFWGWYRVLASSPSFTTLGQLVLGAAVVVPVVTVSWILHNRGIHRRKGPRRHVPTATLEYRTDFHGLEVAGDFRALQQAQHVQVVIEGARKVYRAKASAATARHGEAEAPASP
jgi:hypothetical protein